MINFIYGRAGSGKTTRICDLAAKSVADGKRVFLLVPEQMALDTEKRMTVLLENSPSLSLEILNFRRLCNHIFREVGGLSYSYITKSGQMLLMWRTLTELAPMLKTIPSPDRNYAERMLSVIAELKTYCISPALLELGAKKLGDDEKSSKLRDKLLDVSLIYAAYVNLSKELGDDADDDLTNAAKALSENNLFADADIFLDAFWGFTPQQFAIIGELFRQADNVTVSLCLDGTPDKPGDGLFENQHSTAAHLLKLAKDSHAEISESVLAENHRAKNAGLCFLEKNLWSLDLKKSDVYSGNSENIKMVECQSLFAECEAVATDILKKVREGASWRDFTVVTRGLDRYDGILDVILEKYGIPHFISIRNDIKTHPIIKLILTSLSLYTSNFECEDMISYIKTGLCGLSPNEVSALENYITLWSIRGRSRVSEDFTMNPAGYTAKFTEDSQLTLDSINELRVRVVTPILDFHEKLRECKTTADFAATLYAFLVTLNIPETLQKIADAERETAPEIAKETEQLWSVIIDAIDEIVLVMPDVKITIEVFSELLKIIFDETDIGKIPAAIDSVVCGDASLLRADSKHIYIIGANDGIFPAAPSSIGFFSDREGEILSEFGIELAPGGEYQAADERFLFYRAVASASDSLTVIWSSSDLSGHGMKQSLGVARIKKLFPDIKPISYADIPIEERLEGRNNLLEFIAETDGTPLGAALREYAMQDGELSGRLDKLALPLCDDKEQLDNETAASLFGGDLAMTQSRLETFVLCKFSYFCKYVLKLEEKKSADFNPADIGSFIHHILEKFVRLAEEKGGLSTISDNELDTLLDEIVSDYITRICRLEDKLSGSRMAHLFAKLKRSSRLLCKNLIAEFSESQFSPKLFEAPIGIKRDDEKFIEPLKIALDDESSTYIYGIADRVDIYEKDDKFYVRVVDYKTGSKEFSTEELKLGLNMQMLLYLFSIWKNGKKPNSGLSIPVNSEILPAGVLYFSAGVPTVTLDHEISSEEVESMVSGKLSRRGLLLDDREVLDAMENGLSGKHIPVKQKKDGTLSGSLASLEDFKVLLTDMEDTIKRIGKEMKSGNAEAMPLCDKKHDGCVFCPMKPVCRKDTKKG